MAGPGAMKFSGDEMGGTGSPVGGVIPSKATRTKKPRLPLRTSPGLFEGASGADTEAFHERRSGTEACEGGLKKVETDEGSHEMKARVDPDPERETRQDESAGQSENRAVDIHTKSLFRGSFLSGFLEETWTTWLPSIRTCSYPNIQILSNE